MTFCGGLRPTVLAHRDALRTAGGFDEDPVLVSTEDYDLWLRLARQGPLAYQDLILAYYRIHIEFRPPC